jgi:hypothetical protein
MADKERSLKVLICHAPCDKAKARELYYFLKECGIQPWLDTEDLLPGQNWELEIQRILGTSDAIIICLSKSSVDKVGQIQKEIKFALDKALEIPDGDIFLIPARLEECDIPYSLRRYQRIDLFEDGSYEKLKKSFQVVAEQTEIGETVVSKEEIKIQDRILEAAIEKEIIVGRAAQLFVLIKLIESKGILSVVKLIDEEIVLDESNIKTGEIKIEFPIENHKVLPAGIILRLNAPDFSISFNEKHILIPPDSDSELVTFIVLPNKAGKLLINIEVLNEKDSLASRTIRMVVLAQDPEITKQNNSFESNLSDLFTEREEFEMAKNIASEEPEHKSNEKAKSDDEKMPTQPTKLQYNKDLIGSAAVLLAAIITALATIYAAFIAKPITMPIATVTTTATITQTPSLTPPLPTLTPSITPNPTSTPIICPYQGATDDETIQALIKAEADAAREKNMTIIDNIFDPNAVFHDYDPNHLKTWQGVIERYEKDLFIWVNFKSTEHFDILPVGDEISGNKATYTSGSNINYQIKNGAWTAQINGSSKTTQYGSEHWILKKNNNGCWVIIQMDFDAGHVKFP